MNGSQVDRWDQDSVQGVHPDPNLGVKVDMTGRRLRFGITWAVGSDTGGVGLGQSLEFDFRTGG